MKENLISIPEDLEISSVGEKANGFSGEISLCQEFTQSISLDAKVEKCFNKCSTFPVSREVHATGTSVYSRSISLPSSSTIVSAMKGGGAPKLDCRVKWAPEVYEPPVTSMSHTVKAHPQRSKYKRKDKRKYKGKSSRGNGNEGKHGKQKNSNSESKEVEYNFKGQEGKCGSSFLMEGHSKVHHPIGEAV